MLKQSYIIPLFEEEWYDSLSDNPVNKPELEPTKQIKNGPFQYIYDNNEVLIAEMDGDKYIIDLISLDNVQSELWKELATDYVGVDLIPSGLAANSELEPDFETADIHSLADIPGKAIVSYVNDNYPNYIQIGTTLEEFETGQMFVIKINDEIKQEVLSVYDHDEQLKGFLV